MTPNRLRLVLVSGALAIATLQPLPVRAVDPSAAPDPGPSRPLTCLDRYPADGPAGVDLLLGCIVNEVTQAYLGAGRASDAEPPGISAYLGQGALLAGVLVLLALALRAIRDRAGRRLAPALPTTWWSCRGCKSLNAAGRTVCYRCGRPQEAGTAELRTDAEPPAPQSFGRRIDVEASDRRPGPGVER